MSRSSQDCEAILKLTTHAFFFTRIVMKVCDFDALTAAESSFLEYIKSGSRGVLDLKPKDQILIAFQYPVIRSEIIRAAILNEIEDLPSSDEKISIIGATIKGSLDLSGRTISREVYFSESKFEDVINFERSSTKTIAFGNSELRNGLRADGIEINGDLFLNRTSSNYNISIIGSRITGILDCNNINFKLGHNFSADRMILGAGAFLDGIVSSGFVVLSGANIGADLYLRKCRIGTFIGDKIKVLGDAYVDKAEVNGHVRFTRSTISGNLSFLDTNIKGNLSCDNANILGSWMCRDGAEIEGIIDLSSSNIYSISDDYDSWPTEIILDQCTYHSFAGRSTPTDADSRISWLSKMNPKQYGHTFWSQPYEECARALLTSGDEAGAKKILIVKEQLQQKVIIESLERRIKNLNNNNKQYSSGKYDNDTKNIISCFIEKLLTKNKTYRKIDLIFHLIFKKYVDRPARYTIGYGHHPLGATLPLIALMIFGGIIFSLVYAAGGMKPTHLDVVLSPEWVSCQEHQNNSKLDCYLKKPEGLSYPEYAPLHYSIDTILPIVSLDIKTYWGPDDSVLAGQIGKAYLWIHMVFGWGLALLAVAGFSGLVKTGGSSSS